MLFALYFMRNISIKQNVDMWFATVIIVSTNNIRVSFNNHVTQSCLYAIFRWLISHVQLSFQSLSAHVLRRLTDIRGDTVVAVRITDHRGRGHFEFGALRNCSMIVLRNEFNQNASFRFFVPSQYTEI